MKTNLNLLSPPLNLMLSHFAATAATALLPEMKCSNDLTCWNGGKCEISEPRNDGVIVDVCYCSDVSGARFVGVDCSIKAPTDPKDWCNSHGAFCLNNGTCNTNHPDELVNVCTCKEGYTGKYCDLEVNSLQIQMHIDDEQDHDNSKSMDECNPKCENGGVCTFGYRDPTLYELTYYSDSTLTAINVTSNYQHCQCPPTYFGRACEHQVTICGANDDNNPQHFCHNGAPCVNTGTHPDVVNLNPDDLDIVPPYVCDCTAIGTKNHYFIGTYCEYEDVKICNDMNDDPNVDSITFCTKMGTCLKEDPKFPWVCDCAPGYYGKHCELSQDAPFPDMDYSSSMGVVPKDQMCQKTICQNDGTCFFGIKDTSDTILGNIINKERPNSENDLDHLSELVNEHYEHCQCPSGFTGVHCEVEFTTCPSGQHVCFHGSTCVDDNDKCSCNDDDENEDDDDDYLESFKKFQNNLAGKYCQHKATSKCGDIFCYNDGICVDDSYCRCKEGWRGPFCSFSESVVLNDDDLLTQSKLTENYSDKLNPNLIVVSGILTFVGILITIVVVAMTDHQKEESYDQSSTVPTILIGGRQQQQQRERTAAPPPTAFLPSNGSSSRSPEGTTMVATTPIDDSMTTAEQTSHTSHNLDSPQQNKNDSFSDAKLV